MIQFNKPLLGSRIDPEHPLSKGLVLCLLFNEGSGNRVYDISGNRNDGVFGNDPEWAPGRTGAAIDFDGGNDYIGIVNLIRPPHITISARIKSNSVIVEDAQIASADDVGTGNTERSWQFRLNKTTGYARFIVFVGSSNYQVTGSDNLSGNWHHVVGVYDGNEAILYGDGSLVNSNNSMSGDLKGGEGIAIGSLSDERLQNYFNGLIDDVRIWNRALSTQEVQDLYINPYGFIYQPNKYWFNPVGVTVPIRQLFKKAA